MAINTVLLKCEVYLKLVSYFLSFDHYRLHDVTLYLLILW